MKKRLLALSTSYPLRSGSSSGVFVQRLYAHFPESWCIEVICPDDDNEADVSVAPGDKIYLRPVRYGFKRWQKIAQRSGGIVSGLRSAPWRIMLVPVLLISLCWNCILRSRKTDAIHANWAICGLLAGLAGILTKRPVITTLRGDDAMRAEHSMLDRWILTGAIHASQAITCVSKAMAEQLQKQYPLRAADIHVCLNGVDARFLDVTRSTAPAGRLRVAAIGSLIRRKGFDILIDAVARMHHRDSISVRIAGDGPELNSLRVQAQRLGVQDAIKFEGQLAPVQIPALLADSDVLVMSSRSEGRPNVVLEALASGIPVISSDLPGVKGLLEHGVNGWEIPGEDPSSLAAALDEAVASPDKRLKFGEAARVGIVRTGYTWHAAGERYAAIIDSVVRGYDSKRRLA